MDSRYTEILRKGEYGFLTDGMEYIVAYGYDPSYPDGSKWVQGHYFSFYDENDRVRSFSDALEFFKSRTEKNYITYGRMSELATRFKDCAIGDEDIDYVIDDMEENEIEYFEIEREEE